MTTNPGNLDIAIVGMAGRFPGAKNLEEFWSNLVKGVESISWCSEQEVIDSGFHPEIARDPEFIPAAGKLADEYTFDADFFGFAPREAQILDPQHRVLLECAWEALESAGYNPQSYPGRIGVYAGASTNTYFPFHIAPNHQLLSSVGLLQAITANDKDFLASRVAYKLNLKGPAISVQTACSTSLVAVNLACQSLLNYQCDMVLAGGVSVTPKGRLYKDGFIFSRDGHCRPFDESANGAVFGNGVGVVVLKRIEDAVANGDYIYAVIKGSAINNDGSLKAGFTAPSVTGQMEAIVEAHALSGIDPQTIGYIEAHGTGTSLGDPIEIAALTQSFQAATNEKSFCALGSVKGNIGHLDAAAGIAGLIKTALVLDRKQIPPTLHFQKANPRLNLENSPFFINAEPRDWTSEDLPRRAAVSSFGFGGTNAHAVMEEAPTRLPSPSAQDWHLVPISAHTKTALQAASVNLAGFFDTHPAADLGDVAFTLQSGRKHFKKRAFAVVNNGTQAAKTFRNHDSSRFNTANDPENSLPVIFMFPGQGSQAVNMAREVYESEPLFREIVDQCAQLATRYLYRNLIDVIYPQEDQIAESESLLTRTEYAQPSLFIIEYALARLWQSWGVQPASMIGHSLGEYVAACLAGVFSIEDAIKLICARGVIMQKQPAGEMMSVPLGEMELKVLLPADLSLAAVNAPDLCVVSGPAAAISNFQSLLASHGISGRRLHVSHAFHSQMMEAAAHRFFDAFEGVKLSLPSISFVSNVTGDFARASDVCNPEYWVHHLLSAVRFSDGWLCLAQNHRAVFLEIGPSQVLTTLSARCGSTLHQSGGILSLSSCSSRTGSDRAHILTSLGNLWVHGIKVDWNALHRGKVRRRIPLPTYPFERKLYWLSPVHAVSNTVATSACLAAASLDETPASPENPKAAMSSVKDNDLENVMTSIWREVLGVDAILPEDNFFVLGGHSLMAIQLIAEIRRQIGIEIPVKAFFQEPTVAALVTRIRNSHASTTAEDCNPAIQPIPRDGDLPLTFHQADVWEFETTMPGTARFTGVISLSLRGNLVHNHLEFALNQILARHEVLRTTYCIGVGCQPVARINPPQVLSIPVKDISHLESEARRRELLQSANRLVRTPFDLSCDVLFRVLLFKTGESEHVLIFSSHYIAMDGWTVGLILKELSEHYAACVEARPSRVPDVKLQCVDFAQWQRSQLSVESLASHQAYWRRQLMDVAPQEPVPLDFLRPRNKTMRGSTFHLALTPDLTRSLKHFSHQHGSTLFFTLLSMLNILFHTWSGSDDIVIGTITGDRDPGMETVFGSFVNCLPLRNHLYPEQTFLEVMENTSRCTTDAYTHQIPFHKIVETVNQTRDLIDDPLFRISLVLRNIPFTEMKSGGLEIQLSPLPVDRAVSEGDISLYLQDVGGVLSGYFEYDNQIFESSTMERLAADFITLLSQCTANPQAKLCDLTASGKSVDMVEEFASCR
ncbi:MAG TPA: condensation domain-containing protein [Candidatus Angelobacter sp.]|jgi:acyl transferase domain-containing protein|nr:condensation domain-containing protein [Candidatus Angelobacter sp.]